MKTFITLSLLTFVSCSTQVHQSSGVNQSSSPVVKNQRCEDIVLVPGSANFNDNYVKASMCVGPKNNKHYEEMHKRISTKENLRLLGAAMGLSSESGEVMDAIRKHFVYGKPLDKINLMEEMGDIYWYLAELSDTLGVSPEIIMKANSDKLRKRYPSSFTNKDAIKRDLNAERKALENVLKQSK